jgi:hypothetical protein
MRKTKQTVISQINLDKLFQTKLHFKIILDEGFRIIDENKNEFHIYHSLFKRYIYCFESVNVLLSDFNIEKRYRELPISIVLRASLLDYLTTLFLGTYQAEKKFNPDSNEYKIVVDKLVSEQIRRIISVAENDKKTHFYNHTDHCQTVDLLKEKFSHLFDLSVPIYYNKPGKSLIYKQFDDIKSTTIRKRLDSVSNQLENIRYEDVFYLYDLFSKYDHFGTASMFLEYVDIDSVSNNILGAIFYISEGLGFCIDLMKEEVNCKSNFDKINHEIALLRGTIYSKTFWLSEDYKNRNK